MFLTESEADRATALARLEAFIPHVPRYAKERNYATPDAESRHRNVSELSPYFRHRLLNEVEAIERVLEAHDYRRAEKFISEIGWRIYWKGWLEMRPKVWRDYLRESAELSEEFKGREADARRWAAAEAGETGIECFDAWARELVRTGYLHNHVRMWFASIWIFTLRLPWQLGAAFFMGHLLDGDPASNTLSWRWVAGLHTKGKHYLARADNIAKYTGGRFNPAGLLDEDAEPCVESVDYERKPPKFPEQKASSDAPYLLLLTEDDCGPAPKIAAQEPVAVCTLPPEAAAYAGPVARFKSSALRSAAEAAKPPGRPLVNLEGDDAAVRERLSALAAEAGAHVLVHRHAPTGYAADRLARIFAPKIEGALSLEQRAIVRPEDEDLWPHATAGFFKFKKALERRFADRS